MPSLSRPSEVLLFKKIDHPKRSIRIIREHGKLANPQLLVAPLNTDLLHQPIFIAPTPERRSPIMGSRLPSDLYSEPLHLASRDYLDHPPCLKRIQRRIDMGLRHRTHLPIKALEPLR